MKTNLLIVLILIATFSCSREVKEQSPVTAWTGATIIDGSGGSPVANGVILVRNGRISAIGKSEQILIPEGAARIDISGKTVMPGIINAHGHVGNVRGIEGGHYSRENVVDNLKLYARYGVTTVVSLGDDREEGVPLRHKQDSTATGRARLFIAGAVIAGDTPEAAAAMVDSNHHMGVDFMKIRVDDNLGTGAKMSGAVYHAVIERAHALGYRVATHMYYLEDARKLLEAGSDLLAHSVRDAPVDETFIRLIKEKNVGYCPTLTREVSTFVYGDTAAFFDDPFFTDVYDAQTVGPLMDPARQLQVRNSRSAQIYRQQLPLAMANLKTLSDQGVPVVFGTDSGVPTRFMGYFEHLEMQMMADAGLTPMQIITAASRDAAKYMGISDLGTLTPGNWADFIVLDKNPLDDIRNTRSISTVVIGGAPLQR